MTVNRWAYAFEAGDGRNKMLLGGKGANLCEMTRIGLNVPPGFVVTTEACLAYLADSQRQLPAGVMDEVRAHMRSLEQRTGKRFGGGDDPLLVSVRSGSAMSMPGMMDTILNLGLNATTLAGSSAGPATSASATTPGGASSSSSARSRSACRIPFDEQFEAVKARVGRQAGRDARSG
jgi:pyruvate, orthophosphate dikinase